MSKLNKTLLVCPTLNPGGMFNDWLCAYGQQKEKPAAALIIDSTSDDGSVEQAKEFGFSITVIDRKTFNHGATRQKAIDDNEGFDFVIFLTQDALLYNDKALSELLSAFDSPDVAAVCGRQLPHKQAKPIEAHARLCSYSTVSNVRSLKDAESLGIKAAFLSNSFAAYRISALQRIGGFPDDVIFAEDMYVAAKLLLAGYSIAYAADACVYHSHNYSFMQELRRYFDMGVFHAREPWIRQRLGSAEGAGAKFIVSEFKYLLKHAIWQIPESFLRTMLRYIGFRLGIMEHKLPIWLKRKLAMNKGYFADKLNKGI